MFCFVLFSGANCDSIFSSRGDETAREKFVEIADAYDVLSTPTTRKIYDQYGYEGVEQHHQGGSAGRPANDPFDLFSLFFGGG